MASDLERGRIRVKIDVIAAEPEWWVHFPRDSDAYDEPVIAWRVVTYADEPDDALTTEAHPIIADGWDVGDCVEFDDAGDPVTNWELRRE